MVAHRQAISPDVSPADPVQERSPHSLQGVPFVAAAWLILAAHLGAAAAVVVFHKEVAQIISRWERLALPSEPSLRPE